MKNMLFAITCLLLAAAGPAVAREGYMIGKISAAQRKAIIESWGDPGRVIRNVREAVPDFKAPAVPAVRCRLADHGIMCFPVPGAPFECPKELPFEVPGQSGTVNLPVNCVGPDDEGNCECEIATGK